MDALYVFTSTNLFFETKSINKVSYACLNMIGPNLVCVRSKKNLVCVYIYFAHYIQVKAHGHYNNVWPKNSLTCMHDQNCKH
jgi:hypothetical protein